MILHNKTGLEGYMAECGIVSPLPSIAGRYSGHSLVICADAKGIWDDLERFGCRCDDDRGRVEKSGWHIMTVNKMVEVLPGDIEHCYSNAPGVLNKFMAARRPEYFLEFEGPLHSHSLSEGCNWKWPFGGHATSGLGATLAGLAMGYERIVLCGMPLDDGPHNGEPHWRKTAFASSEAAGNVNTGINSHWKKARDLAFQGKVRSMSGRTKDWLGDAREWA